MTNQREPLMMIFTGTDVKRSVFLREIHYRVMEYVDHYGMGINSLLVEIAKNIYDHANGRGSLTITPQDDETYLFEIWDEGTGGYDFEEIIRSEKSRLKGNGVNCGAGLTQIQDYADTFTTSFKIDTTKGFRYSGTYDPKKLEN
ncbi:MAG: hypothetical protein WCJ59_02560 [bacterium]